jgi:hypothetical protein
MPSLHRHVITCGDYMSPVLFSVVSNHNGAGTVEFKILNIDNRYLRIHTKKTTNMWQLKFFRAAFYSM